MEFSEQGKANNPGGRSSADPVELLASLQAQLQEAQEQLRAIRTGEIDALLLQGRDGARFYTRQGSDQAYRLLVEAINEGAVMLDRQGGITYANRAFAALLGRPLEEVLGSNVMGYVTERDRPGVQQLLHPEGEAAAGWRLEARLLADDGHEVPVYLSLAGMHGQDVPELCMVVTDLTEQQRGAHLLAEERLARSILDQVTEAVVVCDPDGRVLRASRSTSRLIGGKLYRRPLTEVFPLVPLDSRAPTLAALVQGALAGRTEHGIEMTLAGSPGEQRDLLVSAGPLQGESGQRLGCLVVLTDITRLRQTERASREFEQELRQAQKMEAMGALASGLAHEFNNVLTALMACLERSREGMAADDPAQQSLAMARKVMDRAMGMGQSLLSFSRQANATPEVFDLVELVRESQPLLRQVVPAKVQLEVLIESALPSLIKASAGQLQQVLLNLVINARDAMPQGGTLRITVDAADNQQWVQLRVEDTGVGMSEEVRSRIFEPFFTTKPRGQGTGLGLAISAGIVKEHHGTIAVESAVGVGTSFTVSLPAAAPAVQPAAAAPPPALLLIAEDNPFVQRIMESTLRGAGYQLLVAGDGQQALELFRQQPEQVRLAILDVNMPLLGGVACLEQIRQQRPQLPALLMSGDSQIPASSELERQVQVLTKPFEMRALLSAVQGMLQQGA